jgi:hypothetical protein
MRNTSALRWSDAMSARQRKAAARIAAMSESERQALQAAARQALITHDRCLPVAVCVDLPDRLPMLDAMDAAKRERQAAKAARIASSQAWADRESESESVSLAWRMVGILLEVAGRLSYASLPETLRRLAIARPMVSNWLTSCVLTHHYHWVVRQAGRRQAGRQATQGRMREYPLGYASARGGWHYRAGCERHAVQGYTGKVQVSIRYRDLLLYVPAEVQAAAIEAELSPAVAVRWHDAAKYRPELASPAVIERSEPADFSLHAAGIDTGKGYAHARSGRAYDPRDAKARLLALAQRGAASDPERRQAALRKAIDERQAAEQAKAAARIQRELLAQRGRLVKD